MGDITIRTATPGDAPAIAEVFSASFRLLDFLPVHHTEDEDRGFIDGVILRECVVTVAEADGGIVSFLARQQEEIRMLYTRPDLIGGGAGGLLLDAAKGSGVGALELWCFQANLYARRFYERRGFKAVRMTDGQDNEERMPDILYRWQRDLL